MPSCEYLSINGRSERANAILEAMREVHPGPVTNRYEGKSEWLMLWGVGFPAHAEAAKRHAGPVSMWDLGYRPGYSRVALNHWHPTPAQIDATEPDPSRFDELGIELRNDGDPNGPILLIGMGPKSKRFLNDANWESRALRKIQKRYPGKKVIFRPKPKRPAPDLGIPVDRSETIVQALKGKSLVVCRHSNVGVDAAIAGVPCETVEGAAKWLEGKEFTPDLRMDFLRRLAWWQWKQDEASKAWKFIVDMSHEKH